MAAASDAKSNTKVLQPIMPEWWSSVSAEGRYAFTRTLYRIRKLHNSKLSFLQPAFIQFAFGPHLPSTVIISADKDIMPDGSNYGPWSYTGELSNGLRHGSGVCDWHLAELLLGANQYPSNRPKDVAGAEEASKKDKKSKSKDKDNERVKEKASDFGNVYDGMWCADKMHGAGKLTYGNGKIYDGAWCEGAQAGFGRMTFLNGSVYQGEWKYSRMHGKGTMTYAHGRRQISYVGDWFNGMKEGWGELRYNNKSAYVGGWWANKKSGFGVHVYSTGAVYEGAWYDNKRHGKGKMTCVYGCVMHDCTWERGTPLGPPRPP